MKAFLFLTSVLMLLALPGCAVAGGIFKAGVWVGILGVVVVVAIIIAIVGKARK
ncbi:phosphatidate cytidylyltransferase [Puia sp. P3]|uniref:phosphatidate cytidylyltransferase n=1 Tax=Puia sp. P3 TaxID=3423952 RepID=UPI003D669C4D